MSDLKQTAVGGPSPINPATQPDKLLAQVAEAIKALRYGKVEILVQEGHIVLVEKHERERIFRD